MAGDGIDSFQIHTAVDHHVLNPPRETTPISLLPNHDGHLAADLFYTSIPPPMGFFNSWFSKARPPTHLMTLVAHLTLRPLLTL